MRSFRIFILMAVLMTAFVVNAHAAVMTFTHESAMSGHIGATYFTNARFIISAVGDTENRKSGVGIGTFHTIRQQSILRRRYLRHLSTHIDIL